MSDYDEPYHPAGIYYYESIDREPMDGILGGPENGVVEDEPLEITADIRQRASYLSPYRMDHIAELHSDQKAGRDLKKTLFPANWSDDKIFEAARAVVVDSKSKWTREFDLEKGGGKPGTFFNPWHDRDDIEWEIPARLRVDGWFDDIKLRVIVEPYGEGIITAYTLNYKF